MHFKRDVLRGGARLACAVAAAEHESRAIHQKTIDPLQHVMVQDTSSRLISEPPMQPHGKYQVLLATQQLDNVVITAEICARDGGYAAGRTGAPTA